MAGSILADTNANIDATLIHDNTAAEGGGIYVTAASLRTIKLRFGASVHDNHATSMGGGLCMPSGRVDCEGSGGAEDGFVRNTADAETGGVHVAGTGVTTQFTATACDFGVDSTSDTTHGSSPIVSDVHIGTTDYAFGDDATFICTASVGTCL